ncbi:MAG: Flp pilus assembly protein CpaB [Bacillota bacterium]|nr:Flp pilus assembly protein CpaB [Bacillota bacterium]
MLKGSRRYWVIAVICGLAAAGLSYYYLQGVKERYQPDDLVQVIKAKVDIKQDTLITADQIEVIQSPKKYVHPQAQGVKNDVIGKIAISKIVAGEEILEGNLLSAGDKAHRLAYAIPAGSRAVSVPVNDVSGVSGFVKPGDRVDIIATVDIPMPDSQGVEKPVAFSVLTLQDIEVLAVGGNPDTVIKKNDSGVDTLTLSVTNEEAQPLVLASERGSLRLLLRSPVDHSHTMPAPYQIKDFMQQPGALLP